MTNEEADFQIELFYKQLDLMRIYEKDLLFRFGRRGYEERIDIILDNLIIILKFKRKYK
jgi:hypothetical protein